MKAIQKNIAIQMRRNGKSYKEILEKVLVSKSTLSLWLRHIELTNEQKHRLYFTLKQKNAYRLAKENQNKKTQAIVQTKLLALNEFNSLEKNNFFIAGLMLYWAEGDKSKDVEMVKFSNSDPEMITYMMGWFRQICHVAEKKFHIALHIHELQNEAYLKKFWSLKTNVPDSQFIKTWITESTLKFKHKPLYKGTCSIRIYDKNLFRKITTWIECFVKKVNI